MEKQKKEKLLIPIFQTTQSATVSPNWAHFYISIQKPARVAALNARAPTGLGFILAIHFPASD